MPRRSVAPSRLPRVFHVNWFRKSPLDGRFLWPGFGENLRVLKWICGRLDNSAPARPTPIGLVPTAEALDVSGLELPRDALAQLLAVPRDEWSAELRLYSDFYAQLGDRLPATLREQLGLLAERLNCASNVTLQQQQQQASQQQSQHRHSQSPLGGMSSAVAV